MIDLDALDLDTGVLSNGHDGDTGESGHQDMGPARLDLDSEYHGRNGICPADAAENGSMHPHGDRFVDVGEAEHSLGDTGTGDDNSDENGDDTSDHIPDEDEDNDPSYGDDAAPN